MRFTDKNHGCPCFVCGKQASAGCSGIAYGTVGICSGCAVTVLPVLIGEAIDFAPGASERSAYEHARDLIDAGFWKAAAYRSFDTPDLDDGNDDDIDPADGGFDGNPPPESDTDPMLGRSDWTAAEIEVPL